MANMLLSRAARLFLGEAYFERYNTSDNKSNGGVEFHAGYFHSFGAPVALDTNAFVAAATGAELPNASTITYTTASGAVSPIDDAGLPTAASVVMADGVAYSVWPLDVPRNITGTVTHGSSIVAMTVTINGFDQYGVAMSETITVTATGTSKTLASLGGALKAYKWIKSIVFTAAGDATANTISMGFGDVLGVPFRFASKNQICPMGNGALDASATLVVADDNTATATTGDVRGTVDFNTASDGTKTFAINYFNVDRTTKALAFGVTQA